MPVNNPDMSEEVTKHSTTLALTHDGASKNDSTLDGSGDGGELAVYQHGNPGGTCSLQSGATCKPSCNPKEHLELCSNLIVPCINSEFGCPRELIRKNLNSHLESCPASVVMCKFEGCGQQFRRDEYPWHSKNVHSD